MRLINGMISWLFLLLLLYTDGFSQVENRGDLVIVGGALTAENYKVHQQFIESSGGTQNAFISIIPAASSKPSGNGLGYKQTLMKYGLKDEQIQILPLAVLDDNTTHDVDESTWYNNACKKDIIEQFRPSTGLWFIGGDQMRIIQVLTIENEPTGLLKLIYEKHKQGMAIGGSSAGAAIMSETMIAGGSSLEALIYGSQEYYPGMTAQEEGKLILSKGLGFFRHGIVDQHFDRKARLGRLIVALETDPQSDLGFGIDENTALCINHQDNSATVIGAGTVNIVDVSEMTRQNGFRNIIFHMLSDGDKFNLENQACLIAEEKALTNGNEYFRINDSTSFGVLSPYQTFKDLVGAKLVDNSKINSLQVLTSYNRNNGFILQLSKTGKTKGYWFDSPDFGEMYSAQYIQLDIETVKIELTK